MIGHRQRRNCQAAESGTKPLLKLCFSAPEKNKNRKAVCCNPNDVLKCSHLDNDKDCFLYPFKSFYIIIFYLLICRKYRFMLSTYCTFLSPSPSRKFSWAKGTYEFLHHLFVGKSISSTWLPSGRCVPSPHSGPGEEESYPSPWRSIGNIWTHVPSRTYISILNLKYA